MPFTFLPHQVLVLPLAGGRDRRWDGVALVAGSVAPDLFYVTTGWGWGPWGIRLWFDGHAVISIPIVTVLAAVLAVVVRRVVLPVVPLAVHDAGDFHLRSWWTISIRRPRWWVTILSAGVGVLTHLFLDSFTHGNGWVVQNVSLFNTPLFNVAGHSVALYSILQYGGSLLGGVVALEMLRRMGQRGRFAPGDLAAPRALAPRQLAALAGGVLIGVVGGLFYAVSRSGTHRVLGTQFEAGSSAVLIAFCWVAFGGLVAGCVASTALARPFTSPGRPTPEGSDARLR